LLPAGEPAPETGDGDREQPSRTVKTAQAEYRMESSRLRVFRERKITAAALHEGYGTRHDASMSRR